MYENKPYKCVNCGEAAAALYRTYGPSVLKLTKCDRCKGVVDKYIEYDPVIVMIDLVLMSKEAQRHVIYNTEFKSHLKLFIILLMLETFSLWRNDSLFNMTINTLCNINAYNTQNETFITLPINITLPESWIFYCKEWNQPERDSIDLFIWEKDFYVQFLSTFLGIAMFIIISHLMMTLLTSNTLKTKGVVKRAVNTHYLENLTEKEELKCDNVGFRMLTKSHSLSYAHSLSALPALVWARAPRGPQQAAALLYAGVAGYNVFRVLYEGPRSATAFVLIFSNLVKYLTTFHAMVIIRSFIA